MGVVLDEADGDAADVFIELHHEEKILVLLVLAEDECLESAEEGGEGLVLGSGEIAGLGVVGVFLVEGVGVAGGQEGIYFKSHSS